MDCLIRLKWSTGWFEISWSGSDEDFGFGVNKDRGGITRLRIGII